MKNSTNTSTKLNAEQTLAFIASCKGKLAGLRLGQALFNCLYEFNPELADSIRATDADPFHQDSKIPAFFKAITTKEGYENTPKTFKQ